MLVTATDGNAVKKEKTWPIKFNGLLRIHDYCGFYKSDLNRVNDIRGGLGLEPAIFTFGGHGFNAERPRYCDWRMGRSGSFFDSKALYWDRNASFYISVLMNGTINYIQQQSHYPANENHIDVTHSLILDEQAKAIKSELGKTELINTEVFEKCVGEFLKDPEIANKILELKQPKPKFFGFDVVDYAKVLGTLVKKDKPSASWEIEYQRESLRSDSEWFIYALFEDVKSRGFDPSTCYYNEETKPEYNRRFTVEFWRKYGSCESWKVISTKTEVGEPPQEPEEKFTEELDQLLKTKVGSEWLDLQEACRISIVNYELSRYKNR